VDVRRFSPVTRLLRLDFESPAPERLQSFYRSHLGLAPAGPGALAAGPSPLALRFHRGPAPRLRSATYEVDDVDEAARRLQAAGVAFRETPDGLSLADVDGNLLELVPAAGPPNPVAAAPWPFLQHFIYVTADCRRFAAWYERALGMRVSDWQGDNFVWLRCGEAHHVVGGVRGSRPGSLDHFAFEVEDWEDIKRWADRFAVRGLPLLWGPGRHGPGNNLFLFVQDPDGNRVELSAELESFYDDRVDYRPRVWPDPRWTANQWGPQPDWRETAPAER
jgi:catechol 2,3-dioxygenase